MLDEAAVRTWISEYLSEILDVPPADIQGDQKFKVYGLDSADAIIIGGALEEQFDVEVDATLFLRNECVDDLIEDMRRAGLIR